MGVRAPPAPQKKGGSGLHSLNIVLVEPQIPQNTGNIARTCAATGARLHLVGPLGFSLDSAKLKRAGLDYWPYLDVTTYRDTAYFFARCPGPCFFFTTKGRRVYADVAFPPGAWLVFGREDAGLPEELLAAHPDACLRLPMLTGLRSLNLSNTVAVAAYEALRQWGFPALQNFGKLTKYDWDNIQ